MPEQFSAETNEMVPEPSHLKEGVLPIMACVGSEEDYSPDRIAKYRFSSDIQKINPNVEVVDFNEKSETLNQKGQANAGDHTYVFSGVNGKDKFSNEFFCCTSVIACGIDKETGKNVSFMSHQNPMQFLSHSSEPFVEDLSRHLIELRDKCEEGTIDIVIAGGHVAPRFFKDYKDSIKFLSEAIQSSVGFMPRVIVGPKVVSGEDSILFENDSKRLYISRPPNNVPGNQGFEPSDIDEVSKKWTMPK